jgi:uncharacterized protein YndB with AHSA1/START domain
MTRNQEVANMSDRIEKVVELKASPARVWRALTDHVEFGQWFRVKIDAPFEVGKPSTGFMTWPGYEDVRWRATVRAMEPEKLFSYTWPHPSDLRADEPDAPETLVEFRLEPVGAGTRLTIVESGFDAVPADRRMKALRSNTEGWDIQAGNVKAHVEG